MAKAEPVDPDSVEDAIVTIEIELLLEALRQRYGYDFREYSAAHIRRRVLNRWRRSQLESVSAMQHLLLRDASFAEALLSDFSISVTEMFRDPEFYRALRGKVLPLLKTWSYLKLWHAGCSTGEEAYSMAILLQEEGLFDRTQIYATDFNQTSLKQARDGIYAADRIKKYSENYQRSEPKGAFSSYYRADCESAVMDQSLRRNIVWAHHNLVGDSDFAEMQIIVCRNVLIYFNKELQNKVLALFHRSLSHGGVLCLGSKESLRYSQFEDAFEPIDKERRIFRKRYVP